MVGMMTLEISPFLPAHIFPYTPLSPFNPAFLVGSEHYHVIITSTIRMSSMARRLEKNTGKYAGEEAEPKHGNSIIASA
jgi:hypothetical protein